MNKINEVSLLDLIPSNLINDEKIRAAALALDSELKAVSEAANELILYSEIDNLDESILDELAMDFHVDFYDTTIPIEKKRQLIKNALPWHEYKGTRSVVEEIVSTIFGSAQLEEWFEYGGDPYRFRINIQASERGASQQEIALIEKVIQQNQNKRSRLEKINIHLTSIAVNYFASCTNTGEEITVFPWVAKEAISKGVIRIGIGNHIIETISTYPKEG